MQAAEEGEESKLCPGLHSPLSRQTPAACLPPLALPWRRTGCGHHCCSHALTSFVHAKPCILHCLR